MKDLEKIKSEIEKKITQAADLKTLFDLKVYYLGRKGILTLLLKKISSLSKAERPRFGAEVNKIKQYAESLIEEKQNELSGKNIAKLTDQWTDVTEPGIKLALGRIHPISAVTYELVDIFARLGFSVAEGPDIDSDWYNFEALNIPPDHPSRDTQATFFVDGPKNEKWVLRTHTSSVQARVMETTKPPIRVIIPGRVYRRDNDPTHTPMFNQIEGLLIDEETSFAELKGTLAYFVHQFFGKNVKLRFRPHHFPFTEPSAEIDISCTICNATGQVDGVMCRICKGTRWLEILGAGMVHPNVLSQSGIDPVKYRGFAFGTGIDRMAMLKHNIPDLRLLFENDIRFLEQF